MKKAVLLREEFLLGHETYSGVDPVVVKTLIDVLKYLKFKIDPAVCRLAQISPFYAFAYRINSGKLGMMVERNMIECRVAYHEGFHNLIGLRFGTQLRRRPQIMLLNESLGMGLAVYFTAMLAKKTGVDYRQLDMVQEFRKSSEILGVPFDKLFRKAMQNPFEAFKKTGLEAYDLNRRIFEMVKKAGRRTKGSPFNAEKITGRLTAKIKRGSHSVFFLGADHTIPSLFVARHCGTSSDAADRRATKKCLELLKQARSMEDFFEKLGIPEILSGGGHPYGQKAS